MTAEESPAIQAARAEAHEFGYRIDEDGMLVHPSGKTSRVRVEVARTGHLRTITRDGQLLWSGRKIGDFLRKFWLATRITTEGENA